MMARKAEDDAPVVELTVVEDTFVDGILTPEVRGSYVRFRMTALREHDGQVQREVVACIVATKDDTAEMLRVVLAKLGHLLPKNH